MVERKWKEGLRNGPFVTWSAAGALESRGFNFKNLRHGQFEEFYSKWASKFDICLSILSLIIFDLGIFSVSKAFEASATATSGEKYKIGSKGAKQSLNEF